MKGERYFSTILPWFAFIGYYIFGWELLDRYAKENGLAFILYCAFSLSVYVLFIIYTVNAWSKVEKAIPSEAQRLLNKIAGELIKELKEEEALTKELKEKAEGCEVDKNEKS